MGASEPIRVLFVCLGNICRSPAAEGNFRHVLAQRGLSNRFEVDSAGTGAWHAGEPPNANAQKAAARQGVKLEGQARQFKVRDFDRFDLILTMDSQNYADVLSLARSDEDRARVRMFREFDPEDGGKGSDVPDPYYGGMSGFDRVQEMMMRTSEALVESLLAKRAN